MLLGTEHLLSELMLTGKTAKQGALPVIKLWHVVQNKGSVGFIGGSCQYFFPLVIGEDSAGSRNKVEYMHQQQ